MAEPLSRQGDAYTLSLTCADGPHEVRFQSGFVPSGFSSAPLELTVHWTQATFGGGDVLVVLRDAGQVVLAGSRGPLLAGRGDVPPDLWAPLSVELLPDVCDIEPEVPGDSGFIAPCFQIQRQALRFSLDGTSVDVYDHGMGELAREPGDLGGLVRVGVGEHVGAVQPGRVEPLEPARVDPRRRRTP